MNDIVELGSTVEVPRRKTVIQCFIAKWQDNIHSGICLSYPFSVESKPCSFATAIA